jgi:Glyoxalase-like domain
VLELDHVFCMVGDLDRAARCLEGDGWVLDAGQAHEGQGTRNRRLVWAREYLELVALTDATEARANPLRFDRRADWTTTGASPFGVGFRGRLEPTDDFWPYDALGLRIWIHRDDEGHPERPLVFVLEMDEQAMQRRASRTDLQRRAGALLEVRLRGPSAPSLPPFAGPPIRCEAGRHRLELVVGSESRSVSVSDILVIRG